MCVYIIYNMCVYREWLCVHIWREIVYIDVCTYTCMYRCMYVYIHTYTYIHTYREREVCLLDLFTNAHNSSS